MPLYGMSGHFAITAVKYADSPDCRGAGNFCTLGGGLMADEDGETARQGKEVKTCSPGSVPMTGYRNNLVESVMVIDKEGYLHTGDIWYGNRNGVVHIFGPQESHHNSRRGKSLRRQGRGCRNVRGRAYICGGAAKKDESLGNVPCTAVNLKKDCSSGADRMWEEITLMFTEIEMPKEIRMFCEFSLVTSGKFDRELIRKIFRNNRI